MCVCVCVCVCVCGVCVCVCFYVEMKIGSKSDTMKKAEK